MNVADFIFTFFYNRGVREVFTVTGGHAMYLNDAVAKNKNLRYTCTHHEQSATMAAEAYGRLHSVPAVAMVTAGPGSVNALNGVVGAWVDSAPLIVISGQSNLPIVAYAEKTGIRQFGVQGISIREMVTPVTKYFVTMDNPAKVGEYLEKMWAEVTTGRPGPVWMEVPLDMQRSEVPAEVVEKYSFPVVEEKPLAVSETLHKQIAEVYSRVAKAERPLFIFGQGVRLSKAEASFRAVIERLRIPLLTSRLGIDLIESNHPLYIGRPGTYGERSANFAVQNADLIIAVGSRLTVSLTGHNVKDFGRYAEKIIVDIDEKELQKPDLNCTLPILSDAKVFLDGLAEYVAGQPVVERPEWLAVCQGWKQKYPVVLPEYKDEKPVNSYYFTGRLTELTPENAYILVDTGSCFHVAAQTWKVKPGQRFLTTGGISTMGYWAAAVGACIANDRKPTVVITGDGSFQMNLQELATVKVNKLPLKIFIFNNNGYLLIRHTQRNFFDRRMIGEGPESGVWCPDALEIAKAYGIPAVRINSVDEVDAKIKEVMDYNEGPIICDVMTPEWQLLIPRVASEKGADGKLISKPYEDMFPFLPAEELEAAMVVKPKKE
jgi:acetolactate synthase-1/2/3 large subunit